MQCWDSSDLFLFVYSLFACCPATRIPWHLIHTFNVVLPLHRPPRTGETEHILYIGRSFVNLGGLDRWLLLLLGGKGVESSSNLVIFSSSHVQTTLRLCYTYHKLHPNLGHPAPLRLGQLGVFIYSKQPYFTSLPEERCSCQISTADLPWESSKLAVDRLLITHSLFSRFCPFFPPC